MLPIRFVVELVGTELTMRPPAGGRQTLVPDSPTVFFVIGQRLEFFLDACGRLTHFVLTIVEKDLKAVRNGSSFPSGTDAVARRRGGDR